MRATKVDLISIIANTLQRTKFEEQQQGFLKLINIVCLWVFRCHPPQVYKGT